MCPTRSTRSTRPPSPPRPAPPAAARAGRAAWSWAWAWAGALFLAAGPALAQQAPAAPGSRGQMLYGHHCIACHTTQMHWRDKKLVTDWPSLQAQVRRWQGAAQLNWSDDDIDDVARYLNDTFYRLPGGGKMAAAPLSGRWR